jgi:hypothetical protein
MESKDLNMELNHRMIATPTGGIKKYLSNEENKILMKEWEKEKEISMNESLLRKQELEERELLRDKLSMLTGISMDKISKIL